MRFQIHNWLRDLLMIETPVEVLVFCWMLLLLLLPRSFRVVHRGDRLTVTPFDTGMERPSELVTRLTEGNIVL